jgi:hypothetical protein
LDHTLEPWRVGANSRELFIYPEEAPERNVVCELVGRDDPREFTDEDEANARRIGACVNACAGIPTEELEGMAPGLLAWLLQQDTVLDVRRAWEDEARRQREEW